MLIVSVPHGCSRQMLDLISDQLQEIVRAVYGMGEYRFKLQYKHLELNSSKWFRVTPQ